MYVYQEYKKAEDAYLYYKKILNYRKRKCPWASHVRWLVGWLSCGLVRRTFLGTGS